MSKKPKKALTKKDWELIKKMLIKAVLTDRVAATARYMPYLKTAFKRINHKKSKIKWF